MSRPFVLLALASIATASIMFPLELEELETFRQVSPDDAIGTFRQAFIINQLNCSSRISHSATVDLTQDPLRIPHSVMKMNSKRCTDGGFMTVFSRPGAAKRAVAESAKDGANVRGVKELIDNVEASGVAALYGVETKGRRCGASSILNFGRGTIIILITPAETIDVNSIVYPAGLRYMIIRDPEELGVCIYSAKLRPEETMEPSPSPETPPGPGVSPGPPGQSPSPSPEMVETPEPSPTQTDGGGDDDDDDDDGSVCFPADATVELEDGSEKTMAQVELGDRVKVGNGLYSDVYMFTHKDADIAYDFVRISTSSGASLVTTKSHYIYINGAYAAASTAKIGDTLELGSGGRTFVTRVSRVRSVGLFNPQTLHGDIIVNSIRASTFTRTFEPSTAQGLLSPFRMIYGAFGWSMSFLNNGADKVTAVLPRGQTALEL